MDGHVDYECMEASVFAKLTDATPLAAFIGFNNEDNELLKVLKALITVQVWVCPSPWSACAVCECDHVQIHST